MGKVIKGSPESPDRYTIVIPSFAASAPERDASVAAFDDDADTGFFGSDAVVAIPDLPPEPAIDLDAIRAQAQELIDDAARSAESVVDEAHDRARALIEAANAQVETIAHEARREAHADGFAAGSQSAQDEIAELLATLRDLVEATRNERHVLIASAEPELVRLAIGIAERVLHQQIALDNGVVVEMAKSAITRIVDREKITVRVNPGDMERMREYRDDLLALGDVKTMLVIEDQRVDRGGVILETDAGSVDAKIATQLTEVRKILHIVDDVVVVGPAAHDSALTSARAS